MVYMHGDKLTDFISLCRTNCLFLKPSCQSVDICEVTAVIILRGILSLECFVMLHAFCRLLIFFENCFLKKANHYDNSYM